MATVQLPEIEAVPLSALQEEGVGLHRFRTELGDLSQLIQSIKDLGLIQPPVVWKATRAGTPWLPTLKGEPLYVILDGCRRVAALKELAKLAAESPGKHPEPPESVPCVVLACTKSFARDLQYGLQLSGLFRLHPNVGDGAVAVKELLQDSERQEDVEAAFGVSQGHISTLHTLARGLIPDAMTALRSGQIDKKRALELAAKVKHDGSPKQAEQAAALKVLLPRT